MLKFTFFALSSIFYIKSERIISQNICNVINKTWLKQNKNPDLCALILEKDGDNYKCKIERDGEIVDVTIDNNDISKVKIGDEVKDFSEYTCAIMYIRQSYKYYVYLNDLNTCYDINDIAFSFLRTIVVSFKIINFSRGSKYLWTDASYLFARNHTLMNLDFGDFEYDFENLKHLFHQCNLENFTNYLDVSNLITEKIKNLYCLFFDSIGLKKVILLKEGVKTINLKNISAMFKNCYELEEIVGIENLDTSNVIDMHSLFMGCYNLNTIDLSKWDTSLVKNMSEMFRGTNFSNLNGLNCWNTVNVRKMNSMFRFSEIKYLDISNFNFSMLESDGACAIIDSSKIDHLIYNTSIVDKSKNFGEDSTIKKITVNKDGKNLNINNCDGYDIKYLLKNPYKPEECIKKIKTEVKRSDVIVKNNPSFSCCGGVSSNKCCC